MRIVITGAEGVVGTVLRRGLPDHFQVRALVRTPQPFPSGVVDIGDLPGLVREFTGTEAVIHLAGAVRLDITWEEMQADNIAGTRNVYEAARLAGVKTVVFASSGHVLSRAEERAGPSLYALDDPRVFDETTPVEPDSLYAVSKIFGETLGRYYADQHGLRVICVRVGMVIPDDNPESDAPGRGRSAAMPLAERYPRIRAKWLSHRDCCQLFAKCLTAGVQYAIVHGTSNNPRQIWSLQSARSLLGYTPQDSAPIHPR
jgi:nucleoside-diphosphate-sugar epimerase